MTSDVQSPTAMGFWSSWRQKLILLLAIAIAAWALHLPLSLNVFFWLFLGWGFMTVIFTTVLSGPAYYGLGYVLIHGAGLIAWPMCLAASLTVLLSKNRAVITAALLALCTFLLIDAAGCARANGPW